MVRIRLRRRHGTFARALAATTRPTAMLRSAPAASIITSRATPSRASRWLHCAPAPPGRTTAELAGRVRTHGDRSPHLTGECWTSLPISCACRSDWGIFCLVCVVRFCANRLLPAFDLSTRELHRGKESKEGKKENEEEKVILSFGSTGAANLNAASRFGGWMQSSRRLLASRRLRGAQVNLAWWRVSPAPGFVAWRLIRLRHGHVGRRKSSATLSSPSPGPRQRRDRSRCTPQDISTCRRPSQVPCLSACRP